MSPLTISPVEIFWFSLLLTGKFKKKNTCISNLNIHIDDYKNQKWHFYYIEIIYRNNSPIIKKLSSFFNHPAYDKIIYIINL